MTNNNYNVNDQGHLTIGGMDAVELAHQFDTPLLVYDVAQIRNQIHHFQSVFEKNHVNYAINYASKAFACLGIYQVVNQEHCHIDVVSGGEIYAALKAGFPASKMSFHGNNKSKTELEMAIDHHVGMIMIDNFHEIDLINQILANKDTKINVMLRLTPGVSAHTHEYDQTGQRDSKFGFDLKSGQADQALQKVMASPKLKLRGIHAHIGSQIFEVKGFEMAAQVLVSVAKEWRDKYNYIPDIINVGGGFGIKYNQNDDPVAPEKFVDAIIKTIKSETKNDDLPMPQIWIEPGRSIIGPAGYNLYTIGSTKSVPEIKPYVAVDGGMGDNIRPALYQAKYEAALANDPNAKPIENVRIAGKYCESGDILIQNYPMPKYHVGDILVMFATGAYGYAMASNYNLNPRPAVVFVENGKAKVVIRRESYEDMIHLDNNYLK